MTFKEEVLNNYDEELNFEQQFDLYNEKLNSKASLPIFDNAVTLLDSYTYLENKHVFVIGFKQGMFPIVKSDNDYLPDA